MPYLNRGIFGYNSCVRNSPSARAIGPRALGVIDSLSAGFGVVNQRPWLILLPVLLDLFFLFGPRVSVAPVVGRVLSQPAVERAIAARGDASFELTRGQVLGAADGFNLLSLLSPGLGSVPSVVPLVGLGTGQFTLIESAGTAVVMALSALVLGALLGSVFRAMIAQQISEGQLQVQRVPGEAVAAWLRVLGFALLVLSVGTVVVLGLAFLTALLTIFAGPLGTLTTALVVTLILWAQLYLYFAQDAIFISRVGPLVAIRRSAAVFRANTWASIGIAVLITIILLGMAQVWVMLAARASWGLALGIVGNAYIASGLVAASMLFYRERVAMLAVRRSA